MKSNWILGGLTTILVGLLFWSNSAAQDNEKPKKKSLVEMASDAMDEAMAKAAVPGEYHGLLEQMAGNWTYTGKMWMQPGAPPMEVSGTSEMRMILGGRYLQQEVAGNFLGQEFKGLGFIGYNNVVGSYETSWMDNMSTTMLKDSGEGDLAKKIITTFGEHKDLKTGKMQKYKSNTIIKNENELIVQWYNIGENGEEIQTMELMYKRK
jgi:hypothetical protein